MYQRNDHFARHLLGSRSAEPGWRRVVWGTVAGLAMLALVPAVGAAKFEQVVPSGGQAEQSKSRVVPVMDHFGGVTVWSEQRSPGAQPGLPSEGPFYLHSRVGGREMQLPVAPRAGTPFDVDLGPDGEGGVVAAYSRCETGPGLGPPGTEPGRSTAFAALPYPAWTASAGCDLYRFDFSTMQESKVAGASTDQASEMLPSIWKDQIAFVRVYEQRDGSRGVYPYLYVRPLDGGRSERQPGGSRGETELPGPTRLDLYGRRLSFVWNYVRPEDSSGKRARFVSRVRLNTVGGGHRVLSEATAGSRAMGGFASFVGPQGSAGRIFYGFQRAFPGEAGALDEPGTSLLLRYSISSGDKALADSSSFLVDTATDGGETYLGLSPDNFGTETTDPGRILRSTSVPYE